jgi:hypothetical protein
MDRTLAINSAFPDFFELGGGRSGSEKMKRLMISTAPWITEADIDRITLQA